MKPSLNNLLRSQIYPVILLQIYKLRDNKTNPSFRSTFRISVHIFSDNNWTKKVFLCSDYQNSFVMLMPNVFTLYYYLCLQSVVVLCLMDHWVVVHCGVLSRLLVLRFPGLWFTTLWLTVSWFTVFWFTVSWFTVSWFTVSWLPCRGCTSQTLLEEEARETGDEHTRDHGKEKEERRNTCKNSCRFLANFVVFLGTVLFPSF